MAYGLLTHILSPGNQFVARELAEAALLRHWMMQAMGREAILPSRGPQCTRAGFHEGSGLDELE
jgi:hypothetical protein